jgi:CubicO group peptidase (beta-lactamase class C family)
MRMSLRVPIIVAAMLALAKPAFAKPNDPLPPAAPESVGVSSQKLAQIDVALQREIGLKTMPGAVVAIARKGKLVYYKAFGMLDADAANPMPKDAIFRIASMTKPLTAVGALTLTEQGRLMLNEPVATYLPALKNMAVATQTGTEPVLRAPTVQDMMRHTGGVTYGSAPSDVEASAVSKQYGQLTGELSGPEFLAKLGSFPLHYQPGTKWAYSFGLDVTGLVVESVASERLGIYLQKSLFAPLGMVDTSFEVPANKLLRVAKPFVANRPFAPGFDNGGGGAYSTAADYLRFAEMLRQGGSLGKAQIVGRKTVEYMTSDQLGPEVDMTELRKHANMNGYGFGLGVAVRRGAGVAGIMGSTGDFNWGGSGGTYFWVDPQEELSVVLMASAGPTRYHMRRLITTLVYATLMK